MMPACHHVTLKFNDDAASRANVVVDRLWNTSDGNVDALLPAQFRELVGAAVGPVPADDVQLIDTLRSQPLHDLLGVESAARRTQ